MSLVKKVLEAQENVERREELQKVRNRRMTVEGVIGVIDKRTQYSNKVRVCIENVKVKGLKHEPYSHIWVFVETTKDFIEDNKGKKVKFTAVPARYSREDFTWAYGLNDIRRFRTI